MLCGTLPLVRRFERDLLVRTCFLSHLVSWSVGVSILLTGQLWQVVLHLHLWHVRWLVSWRCVLVAFLETLVWPEPQEGWRKRVEVIATQIASKEAPLAASISMKLPLSSPERAIASLVAWQNRVAKGQEKHQHVVFRYKAGWGPQTKMNTSRYYPAKEIVGW